MSFQLQRLCLMLMVSGLFLVSDTSYGFQKFKIGNGALLRKVFGDKDDKSDDETKSNPAKADTTNSPAKKSIWPNLNPNADSQANAANPYARTTFDEARQKLEEDSRRLQEELRSKFKSPFKQSPQSSPAPSNPQALGNAHRAPGPINEITPNPNAGNPRMQSVLDRPSSRPANSFLPAGLSPRDSGPQNQPRVPALTEEPADFDTRSNLGTDSTWNGQGFGVVGNSIASGGIQVTEVKPGSMAAKLGIRRGDVLQNVAGLDLTEVSEIDAITNVLQKDDQIEVFFKRDGKAISKMMSGADMPQLDLSASPNRADTSSALPLKQASASRTLNPNRNEEITRLQQQLQQQRAMIEQLQRQLQQQNTPQPLPPPSQLAPPALEDDFSLNLEPPR